MKKNIFILILSLFLITGCTSEYNLEFSNGKIKENIVVNISNSDIPPKTTDIVAEVDDRITPFIENDQYPFMNNTNKKYSKKVENTEAGTRVTMNYTYSHNEYKNSVAYNMCFEDSTFNENRNDYDLNFTGKFFCQYSEEVIINIKTNNEVISNNADKVEGNTYTWVINDTNRDNVNINIKISKKSKITNNVIYVILGVILIILIVLAINAYIKIQERYNVNEI